MKEKTCDKFTYLIAVIVIILFIIFLSGCKSQIQYIPVEVEKTIEIKEEIHDTIIKYVPEADEKKNVVQPSDTSKLKNKYSFSWAFWDGNFLHHFLGTNQDTIRIKIQYKNRITTLTIPVVIKIKGDPVEVNKLTWTQEASVWFTKLVLIALSLYLGVRYRKQIFALFRKLLFKI